MTATNKLLHSALKHDEIELIRSIGGDVIARERRAFPPPPHELLRIGEGWWDNNIVSIQRSICSSTNVHQICTQPTDNFKIALAVLDLVSGLKLGVSPINVAALITVRGLHGLCGDEWHASGPWPFSQDQSEL